MENISLRMLARNENIFKNRSYELDSNYSVNLRKKKRAKNVAIKRGLPTGDITRDTYSQHLSTLNRILLTNYSSSSIISTLIKVIQSFEESSYINPLSLDTNNLIPNIFKLLNSEFSPVFQEELAHIIFLLLDKSGKHIAEILLSKGLIPYLIRMLDTASNTLLETLFYSIGLISSVTVKGSECIINSGYLHKLDSCYLVVNSFEDLGPLFIWTIANLTRKNSELSLEDSKIIVKFFDKNFLKPYYKAQYEVLRAICGISYKSESHVQLLLKYNIPKYCIDQCNHINEDIKISAIKILGNMMVHLSSHIQVLLNLGVLEYFYSNISASALVKYEILWALGNIANGTAGQIAAVVEHQILQHVLQCMLDHNLKVRTEASNVLRNIIIKGCSQSTHILVHSGVLYYLKLGLEDSDKRIVSNMIISSVFLIHHNFIDLSTLQSSQILPVLESLLFKSNIPLSGLLIDFFNQIENF